MAKVGGDSADLHHHESDIELIGAERVPHNGPLSQRASESSAGIDVAGHTKSQDEGHYVEVTMDIQGGSVALHSVKTVDGDELVEDEKLGLIGKKLEKKSSFGASVVQNATIRMKQLKRLASFSKPTPSKQFDRTKSAVAHALTGLKFISKTDGGAGWDEVEKRFDKLTATTDGYLPRALFSKCIGITIY